jgi:hypothetical protein
MWKYKFLTVYNGLILIRIMPISGWAFMVMEMLKSCNYECHVFHTQFSQTFNF